MPSGSPAPPDDDQLMYSSQPPAGWRQARQRAIRSLCIMGMLLFLVVACCGGSVLALQFMPSNVHPCEACSVLLPPEPYGIAMISASDGWAVGQAEQHGAVVHYQRGRWGKALLFTHSTRLLSSFMVSASEGWAVGGGVVAHYHQGDWTTLTYAELPAHSNLVSVTMISPDEGWAVGDRGNGALILHYHQGRWQSDTSSLSSVDDKLFAITMVSSDEGWAGGQEENESLLVHYTRAGGWSRVFTPINVPFRAFSMLSPTEGPALGGQFTYVHYFRGQWTEVRSG